MTLAGHDRGHHGALFSTCAACGEPAHIIAKYATASRYRVPVALCAACNARDDAARAVPAPDDDLTSGQRAFVWLLDRLLALLAWIERRIA